MLHFFFVLDNESKTRRWRVRVLGKHKSLIVESGQDLLTRKVSDFKIVLGPLST